MFSLKNECKNIKIAFLVTSALFFIFTVWFILYFGDETLLGSFKEYNNDDVKYVRTAQVLLEEGRFIYQKTDMPTVFIMPGLPLTIAFFIGILGTFKGLIAFKIFQALLQTLCLMLVFFIGRKVFKSSKASIIAMIFSAIYLVDSWVASLYLTETIFKFLFLTMFYFLIYAIEEKRMKYYVIAGICFGLSLLFRPPVALFPIVVIIMWIIKKYTLKECLKYTVVVALITVTIMTPWWIRNYKEYNMFIPLTISSGSPMYIGTLMYGNDDPLKGTKYHAFRPENIEKKRKPGMTREIIEDYELLDKGKNRVKGYMEINPIKTLRWYAFDKTWKLFSAPFYWFKYYGKYVVKLHYILLGASLIGLVYWFRRRNTYSNFMMLSIFYFVVTAIPFVGFSRYYYHLIPFTILIASFGVYSLGKYLYERIKGEKSVQNNKA